MAEAERSRVEIAFEGGTVLSLSIPAQDADTLVERVSSGDEGTVDLEADDGRYYVRLSEVLYIRRVARESRVGFGSA